MEQVVLTLSIRTHALASRVTLEQIARQVSVWDCQTAAAIYKVSKVTWLTFYLVHLCVWVFVCLFVWFFFVFFQSFASFSSFWSGITVCR